MARCACVISGWVAWLLPAVVVGQAAAPVEEPPLIPIVTVSAASLDRVLGNIDGILESAGREDLRKDLAEGLKGVNELKGVDRTTPLGMSFYLLSVIPPNAQPVFYLNTPDTTEYIKLLEAFGGKVTRKAGTDGEYEAAWFNGFIKRDVFFREDRALMTGDAQLKTVDFNALFQQANTFAQQGDITIRVNVQAIPEAPREILINTMRIQANAAAQRRDNEPLSEYLARKAQGMGGVDFLERILRDGDHLTIRMLRNPNEGHALIDVTVAAKPGTSLAGEFAEYPARPSIFQPLSTESEPLTVLSSSALPEQQRASLESWIAAMDAAMTERFVDAEAKNDKEPRAAEPGLKALLDALRATAAAPQMDLFLQFRRMPGNHGALIGGLRVERAADMAIGLRDVVLRIKERSTDFAVEADLPEHQGVSLHRLSRKNDDDIDENALKIFGGAPSLYIGAGDRTAWFALGGDSALRALKNAMDTVVMAPPEERRQQYPVRITARMSEWLDLIPGNEDDRGRRAAEASFTAVNDTIRLEMQPTEEGLKLRAELSSGMLEFLGRSAESREERRRNRENFRKRREEQQAREAAPAK